MGKINQLFKQSIPKHIVQKVLEAFNLKGLDDNSLLCKYELEKNKYSREDECY